MDREPKSSLLFKVQKHGIQIVTFLGIALRSRHSLNSFAICIVDGTCGGSFAAFFFVEGSTVTRKLKLPDDSKSKCFSKSLTSLSKLLVNIPTVSPGSYKWSIWAFVVNVKSYTDLISSP